MDHVVPRDVVKHINMKQQI